MIRKMMSDELVELALRRFADIGEICLRAVLIISLVYIAVSVRGRIADYRREKRSEMRRMNVRSGAFRTTKGYRFGKCDWRLWK